jgi:SAM-dependent MidA family methyltransferase
MEAALYDPEGGFSARGPRLGARGAFSTAATRVGAFARAVAAEVQACHAALGSPREFTVVEAGPGDGSLAAALAPLGHELVLVERAEGMRRLQREALAGARVRFAASPEEVRAAAGFVVSNELFDDVAVHLLEPPDEVVVDVGPGGGFVEARRPADPALLALVREPRRGKRYAVRPGAPALLARLAATIGRGRLLTIDYGGDGPTTTPVRTYLGGGRGGSPLEAPGAQNLTADVDFAQLRAAARELGLLELRYGPQPGWLRDHGARLPTPAQRDDEAWLLAALLEAEEFRVLLVGTPE